MKIAIESPDKLKDSDLEDTWNRKSEYLFSFNHEFYFAFSHILKKIIGNLTSKGGRDFSKGGRMPPPPHPSPLNETLAGNQEDELIVLVYCYKMKSSLLVLATCPSIAPRRQMLVVSCCALVRL